MRFLVDECVGPVVANWLRNQGHDVFSVYQQARGISDDQVLQIAVNEHRLLITADKDFGEMIFRQKYDHHGVILLRLMNELSSVKVSVLDSLLQNHSDQLSGAFVVVSETQIRFGGPAR